MFNIKTPKSPKTNTFPLLLLLVLALWTFPSTASAWEFDTCSSTLSSEVDVRTPQAMIMVDRSGSMESRIEYPTLVNPYGWYVATGQIWPNDAKSGGTQDQNAAWADPNHISVGGTTYQAKFINQSLRTEPSWGWEQKECVKTFWGFCVDKEWYYTRQFWFGRPGSLWDIAVEEMRTVLASYDTPNGPRIKFGLGTFTTQPAPGLVYGADSWAKVWSEAGSYADAPTFMKFFDHPQQGGPVGGTPTARAIDIMANSDTVSNANTSNAGILITDGIPNNVASGNPYNEAVKAACRHRDVAPMYVLGFSDGTDAAFNNLLAAAGGTGSCKYIVTQQPVDPCSISASLARTTLTCEGAYQADDGDEFKAALDNITNEIACTYPIDVLNTPNGQAPEDPAGTRVYLGQCNPGPGTHTAWGSEFDSGRSHGNPSTTSRAALGLGCTNNCGAVNSRNNYLTYDMPTTPGQVNTVRVRVADYLHNCSDKIKIEVRVDSNTVIGTWTGSGVNDWAIAEFPFTPTASRTFVTVVLANDAYCKGNNSCDKACTPLADDLNLYVDWVKVYDPEANCSATGGLPYVDPNTSARGWTFTENRTKVKLMGSACGEVQNRQHDKVVTQVACPCEQIPGGMCNTSDPEASCPVGTWQCTDEWEDVCVPNVDCELGECAPVTHHDTSRGQPNVQLVVDNSGSMTSRISGSGSNKSRHNTARDVLADLADYSYNGVGCAADGAGCDRFRLGLHFWSASSKKKYSAQEDINGTKIIDAFNANYPSGGTYFRIAGEQLRDEQALKDASAANIGIMVTDGAPSGWTTMADNLEITCNIRKRPAAPIATYVLGLGTANAEHVNSLVAAAGGTGQCCQGSGCNLNDPATKLDPCDLNGVRGPNGNLRNLAEAIYYNDFSHFNGTPVTCEGNIRAVDGDALKTELMKIFKNLECVFPLLLLPDMESASTNPKGTKVNIFLKNTGDLVPVPHIDDAAGQAQFVAQLQAKGVSNASDFADDGWSFANAGRTAVKLSEEVCEQINRQEVTRVDTQVCKSCEHTGEACEVPCKAGEEHCGADGFLMGRCRQGEYICVAGDDVCVQTRNPMPEICNGIDDDCDGTVDDLSNNATDWSDPEWNLSQQYDGEFAALACFQNNVCTCVGGQSDGINGSASDDDEFLEHLKGQKTAQDSNNANCYCGSGLTETSSAQSSSATSSSPTGPHVEDGACSMSGTSDSGPLDAWWLFAVFGLFGAGRVSRRYLD